MVDKIQAVSFRAMQEVDLRQVYAIEKHSRFDVWRREKFHECLRENKYCLVAECEERIRGYGILSLNHTEAVVLCLVVDREYRGRGIGSQILALLESKAINSGAHSIKLQVGEDNVVAQQLYRSCGFQPINIEHAYYITHAGEMEAAIIMEKRISDGNNCS